MKLHNDAIQSSSELPPLLSHYINDLDGSYEQPNLNESQVINSVSCIFCKLTFETFCSFECHLCHAFVERIVIGEKGAFTYTCLVCTQHFSCTNILRKHISWHRKHEKDLFCSVFKQSKMNLATNQNVLTKIKQYTCKYCEKSFLNGTLFLSHIKEHSEFNDDVPESLNAPDESNKKRSLYCQLCSRQFEQNFQYAQHMLGHAKYSCSLCDLSFSTKKLFDRHQHAVHDIKSETKNHECPTCHKVFHRPKYLTFHLRTHSNEKPVPCSVCKTSFRNNAALSQHEKSLAHLRRVNNSDTVKKPFLCDKCGFLYYSKRALSLHMEQLHGESIQYFQCSYCGYKTKLEHNLKRHIKEIHENMKRFVCEICGSAFSEQSVLSTHYNYVHSDKRDFVCNLCSKGFKSKSNLQRHLRQHSEERPYKCHCNQSYKRMTHLKRHMKKAHDVTSIPEEFGKLTSSQKIVMSSQLRMTNQPVEPTSVNCLSHSAIRNSENDLSSMPEVPLLKNKYVPIIENETMPSKDVSCLPTFSSCKNEVKGQVSSSCSDVNSVIDSSLSHFSDGKDFDSLLNSNFLLPLEEDVSKLEDIQPSVFDDIQPLFLSSQNSTSILDSEWMQVNGLKASDCENITFESSVFPRLPNCAFDSLNSAFLMNDDMNQGLEYFSI